MKKELALFDFDGTITTKDSLLDFIQYAVGKPRYYLGLLAMSPILAAFLLRLMRNNVAKEKLLGFYFKGWTVEKIERLGEQYTKARIDRIVRPKAIEKLRWHKTQGHRVILVSASIDTWLKGFCQAEGLELLSTRMAQQGGILTGRFEGANCHGQEKVDRIKACLSLDDYEVIHAYGDSSGDKQMLAIADHPHYRPFE